MPQFPESQWTKLLSGATADFDQVLSSIYASANVQRTTEHIGGLEFSYTNTSPLKRVTNFGDWTIVFKSFAEAFTFIFPHRVDEPLSLAPPQQEETYKRDIGDDRVETPAGTGMLECVGDLLLHVIMPTSAQDVGCADILKETAIKSTDSHVHGEKLRYAHDLIWSDSSRSSKMSLAKASLSMPTVPEPPEDEQMNLTALWTITEHPDLFKVDTPININCFREMLQMYPNQPLVSSVCRSLREGFWPWASTGDRDYPKTYDNTEGHETLADPVHSSFVKEQIAAEVEKGHFSSTFGPSLLSGMYSVPIWVVPKPHSDKLHLVVDHSAGQYSLNSMILKDEQSLHLDGLQQLGKALIQAHEQYPDRLLIVWKSDVSEAYCQLPMHPLWQIKQTVSFNGERRVDRRNDFGGSSSGHIWVTFFALVLWIAVFVKFIADLFAYTDDSFSWDFTDNLVWYEPYQAYYPGKQVVFLTLFNKLGILHEKQKQEHGTCIVVIGLLVNTISMTIAMPDHSL
ncbi:hypothetical protein FISHEDRAFT_68868 [Fistulina hepatica ATCC 64428]|uniref:Uncharacterized protein n=1 Tax=Fistulina hepatica ATCC 64428 TaxID=1128425 RepID=A0A0D7AQC0_9AGAR|nr:hypothetical protein FISHEDRAFT_68868 [Fistulina hepatica ATCC 64428]